MIKELRIEVDGHFIKVPIQIDTQMEFMPLEEAMVMRASKIISKRLGKEYAEKIENAKCLADRFMMEREYDTVIKTINDFIKILLGRSNENAE